MRYYSTITYATGYPSRICPSGLYCIYAQQYRFVLAAVVSPHGQSRNYVIATCEDLYQVALKMKTNFMKPQQISPIWHGTITQKWTQNYFKITM